LEGVRRLDRTPDRGMIRRALGRIMQTRIVASLLILSTISGAAQEALPHRRLILAEYGNAPNRFIEVGPDGKIAWEFKPPSISVIFQLLPRGHILLGYGGNPTGVQEIDRAGRVVWNYVSNCPQVLGCERLPNGNTLVAEQGPFT